MAANGTEPNRTELLFDYNFQCNRRIKNVVKGFFLPAYSSQKVFISIFFLNLYFLNVKRPGSNYRWGCHKKEGEEDIIIEIFEFHSQKVRRNTMIAMKSHLGLGIVKTN